jgi:hypothetical protein
MTHRILGHDDDLDLDLSIRTRQGFVGRSVRSQRLPKPLRQLGTRGTVVPAPEAGSRGAVVKAWRVTPSAKLSMMTNTQRHVGYLSRTGKGVDGAAGGLFTDRDRVVDRQRFVEASADDPHQWRVVLSLPDADRVDMTRFAQRFMAQVQRDAGATMDWLGVVHHDTRYRHVHLVIRGRLDCGEALYFTKHYWFYGMRYRAQELATAMLGRRWTVLGQAQEREATRGVEAWLRAHAKEARRGGAEPQPEEISPAQAKGLREALGRLPPYRAEQVSWVREHRHRMGRQRGEKNAMEIDKHGVPQPREEGTVFRLTFPAGNQVLLSPQQLQHEDHAAASEIEVFHDARWEPMQDGGWMLLGTNERGARATLHMIDGAGEIQERDTFDQEFDQDEVPSQSVDPVTETRSSSQASMPIVDRLRNYLSWATDMVRGRDQGQGMES